jgi:hypothetical protein
MEGKLYSRRLALKAGFAGAGLFWLGSGAHGKQGEACVRIRPIEGSAYPKSFLEFAARARFKHPRDAIASVRDSRLSYDLVWK